MMVTSDAKAIDCATIAHAAIALSSCTHDSNSPCSSIPNTCVLTNAAAYLRATPHAITTALKATTVAAGAA